MEGSTASRTKRSADTAFPSSDNKQEEGYQECTIDLLSEIALGVKSSDPPPSNDLLWRALLELSRTPAYQQEVNRNRVETYDPITLTNAVKAATAAQLHFAAGMFEKESMEMSVHQAMTTPSITGLEQAERRKRTSSFARVVANFRYQQREMDFASKK